MVNKVRERADDFDLYISKSSVPFSAFSLARGSDLDYGSVAGGLSASDPFYHRFRKMPLVSISAAQRKPLHTPKLVRDNFAHTCSDLHRPAFERGSYLAFLGHLSPEKRPGRAIRIAQRVGIPLKDSSVDEVNETYFRNDVVFWLSGKGQNPRRDQRARKN